jgi:hypothetical protein
MFLEIINRVFGSLTGRLRFPQLFGLLATLFVVDLVIPDLVPFVDEIMLFLLTAMVGMIRTRKPAASTAPLATAKPAEKNVTPVAQP